MRFYEKKWFTWLFLILFYPVGLFLLWKYSNYSSKAKKIITGIFVLLTIVGASSDDTSTKNSNQPTQKVEEEKLVAEKKAEEEKLAAEKKVAEEKAKAEKLAAEKKVAEEKAKAEKLAAEKKAAEEKAKAEKKSEVVEVNDIDKIKNEAAKITADEIYVGDMGKGELGAKAYILPKTVGEYNGGIISKTRIGYTIDVKFKLNEPPPDIPGEFIWTYRFDNENNFFKPENEVWFDIWDGSEGKTSKLMDNELALKIYRESKKFSLLH